MKKIIMRGLGLCMNTLAQVLPKKAARIGFNLFCYPFRVPVNAKQRAFLDTADQSTFDYNGMKIQAYQWGKGSKNILLIHGWQSHTYRWKKYIDSLNKDDYTVHAFDAPGHGLSGGKFLSVPLYSEIIESYMKRMGSLETIISHSVGSFSAIYTLYRNQYLPVKKLVTLASPGEAQEFFDFYKKSLSLSDKCSTLIIDHFYERFKKTPRDFSAPLFAAALRIPGLIIHDEDDDDTSVIHSKKIHASWEGSTLIVTKGFGHNLRSDEVLNQVIRFVDEPIPVSSPAHLAPFQQTKSSF
jgi:pimeloyl-ACP methyl ester carboxylesterase